MPAERGDALTPREVAVVYATARGLTRRETGQELGIAESTVSAHVTAIHRKLDVETVVDMLRAFGLVKLPSDEALAKLVDVAGLRELLDRLRADVDAAEARLDEIES